jgi:hypothetical protein
MMIWLIVWFLVLLLLLDERLELFNLCNMSLIQQRIKEFLEKNNMKKLRQET